MRGPGSLDLEVGLPRFRSCLGGEVSLFSNQPLVPTAASHGPFNTMRGHFGGGGTAATFACRRGMPMDIELECTSCGQGIVIDEEGAGKTVPCPK